MTEPRNGDMGAAGTPTDTTSDTTTGTTTSATPPAPTPPTATANTVEADDPLSPLPGEHGIPSVTRRKATSLDWRAMSAVAVLATILIATLVLWISRQLSPNKPAEVQRQHDMPAAAGQPRRLDMTALPAARASSVAPVIPALETTGDEAEPIGVRRTGQVSETDGTKRKAIPEDAAVLLVSSKPGAAQAHGDSEMVGTDSGTASTDALEATKRNLEGFQRQLQGALDKLNKTTVTGSGGSTGSQGASALSGLSAVSTQSAGTTPVGSSTAATSSTAPGLFGGQLQGSATKAVAAAMLGNRSLVMPKGTAFTCALKTKVVSAASGFVGCQVQRNVYGDNGRVLLIERGSHLDGEYRVTTVKPGTVRIRVLWTRVRTPNGVVVALDSPGTGPLGESGIDGYVDNRWMERIGAAMLVSLIDDAIQYVIDKQTAESPTDTVLLPSSTTSTSQMAEKVLDSTINIPPLVYQNQGGIVGIYVARDVDFSSVYSLQAVAR